ncbi:hypothetical protein XCR_1321 [Xanthomonas campestris pv. raphani 756C]|nr:hypothetical protein XCR_1321 [Xanthomonas campestris pv. raphani 756C]
MRRPGRRARRPACSASRCPLHHPNAPPPQTASSVPDSTSSSATCLCAGFMPGSARMHSAFMPPLRIVPSPARMLRYGCRMPRSTPLIFAP